MLPKNLKNSFEEVSGVHIKLASPEKNSTNNYTSFQNPQKKRYWGEVTKVETLNYRTYKPEMGGLFCEKIFGPVKDWECHCGKYKTYRYNGIVCDKCGVEVTEKSVRRERMGYIQLAIPIVHLWYFRPLSNKIGLLLGINTKNVEKIVYYERYVVIQAGEAEEKGVKNLDMLSDDEYCALCEELSPENAYLDDTDPRKFIAKMGGEALEILLKAVDINALYADLKERSATEKSDSRRADLLKRMNVVSAFKESNSNGQVNRPEFMIIRTLAVIPAGVRPLLQLDGGKFATSDVNEHYRRVIIKNNRYKRLQEAKAPDIILRNEKRMLQEAVDALIEKAQGKEREGRVELKSLSDSLKGKQGFFRQNLLGKRVDYSGRSVIVVDPKLKLYQCGLPRDMTLELFKPFLINKLKDRRIVTTVKSAKKFIAEKKPIVWDLLEDIIKGHPVLLNRAPTLHRVGFQGFQAEMVDGKAITLSPLNCIAFNADFDGDQMAVHVPLSTEAIVESFVLMLSSQNIFNSSNGKAIALPSKDMVLGVYYITKTKPSSRDLKGDGMVFSSTQEVMLAFNIGKVDLHANIRVRVNLKVDDLFETRIVDTTPGRVKFNQLIPDQLGFVNEVINAKRLQHLVYEVHKNAGVLKTVEFLDEIKELGFEYAYLSGISIGLCDLKAPESKYDIIREAQEEIDELDYYFVSGLITANERYNKSIDVWTLAIAQITAKTISNLASIDDGFNSCYMMMDSGARGSRSQTVQLVAMKGLMTKMQKSSSNSSYSVIEHPILTSYREGLDVFDYCMSAHGGRKGLADTALKTADAGYLTRRLVEVSQNVIVSEIDCGTVIGITETPIEVNEVVVESMSERVVGRVSLNNIYDPYTKQIICAAGDVITDDAAKCLDELNVKEVEVRSIFKCLSKGGVCSKCYGINLATGSLAHVGDMVGIIAAQSIGEPGTQLTLRTFHVGGIAANIAVESKICSKYDGVIDFKDLTSVKIKNDNDDNIHVVLSRSCELMILDENTQQEVIYRKHIPYGTYLRVKKGDKVRKNGELCYWDPYNGVILADKDGMVVFDSIEEGVTCIDESGGQKGNQSIVIVESKNKEKYPSIILVTADGESIKYNMPIKARLSVSNSQHVYAGQVLCKMPRVSAKTPDITGGLPRVTEVLEARTPSNPAILSEIDGVVSYGMNKGNLLEVFVESTCGVRKKYMLPLSRHILVQPNDYIKAGDRLSEGNPSPLDLLEIKGSSYMQKYHVEEVQSGYRLQGVKINNKHIEVIINQMEKKVEILYSGDTVFVSGQLVYKSEFRRVNDEFMYKKVVLDPSASTKYTVNQVVTAREVESENKSLMSYGHTPMIVRNFECAIAKPRLQGITKASLSNESFLSAASFQEVTKVLSDAALRGDKDPLKGSKECIIVGKLIPAGTGFNRMKNIAVFSKKEDNSIIYE